MSNGIVISSRIFVPKKKIDLDVLAKHYEFPHYDESKCSSCKIYKSGERHSETCDSCPAYLGIAELWNEKKVNGKKYIGLPPGLPDKVAHLFNLDLSKADDVRPMLPLHKKIKFTGKLYDGSVIDGRQTVNQLQMAKDWWKVKNGIIQLPPRSGKTVLAIFLIIKLGYRAIIIANKKQLLNQFYNTFCGSALRKAVTNIKQIEETTDKVLIKIINKVKDFEENPQIALVNYQKFIRNKKSIARIGKYINGKYTTLVIDEGHGLGARAYLKFLTRLTCKYRLMLSATPDRKDGQSRLFKPFIGNIVAKSNVTAKIPKLELVETGVYVKNQYRLWVYAMKHLAKNKERNIMIVRDIFKDLRDGHHSIIIPVNYVDHGNTLLKMINRQAEINNNKRGEKWPEPIAIFYTAAIKRSDVQTQKLFADVDKGKYRVLIAIQNMIKEGIDLLNPTMLYSIVPTSANAIAGGPLFYQCSSRVSTYHPNKRQPIVRIYLDGMAQSIGCLRSLWWLEIVKNLKATKDKPARYLIDNADYGRIMQILAEKQYVPPNKPGERIYPKIIKSGTKDSKNSGGFSSFR